MNKVIIPILLLLVAPLLNGMVGQSFQDIVDQHGEPDEFNREDRLARWEKHGEGYSIIIIFERDGTSGVEIYTSMIEPIADQSIFSVRELVEKFSSQIPRLEYRRLRLGETADIGGEQYTATSDTEVRISPITKLGRIGVVTRREGYASGAQMTIFREGSVRNFNRQIERNQRSNR